MSHETVLTDYILHIGPVEGEPACALLRMPGERTLERGAVSIREAADGTSDVDLEMPNGPLRLCSVAQRHAQLIQARGLYIIQRKSAQDAPEILHLKVKR